MRAHSEDKPSAPQNRGHETLPPDLPVRKKGSLAHPSSGQDSRHDPITALLGRTISVDTPLSRIGSRYANLDRPHIERWGHGAFLVTLCALCALLRRSHRKTLGLTVRELAESTGLFPDTIRRHLQAFEAEGLAAVNADGVWRPTETLRHRKGHYAQVEVHNLEGTLRAIGRAGFRLLCWDRLYTTRKGKLTVQYQRLAEIVGVSRTTVWRGYAAFRAAGIRCGTRVLEAVVKTATSMAAKLQRRFAPTGKPPLQVSRKGAIAGISKAMPRSGLPARELAARQQHLRGQLVAILKADAPA